jgi:hypothetical protein
MPFLAPLPHLTRPLGEARTYKLVGALTHSDGDTVPSGYRTDLASIPRALHWLIPPAGPYEAAAVRHDVRCDALNAGRPPVDSRTTDRAFRQDLRDLGMGVIRRWMMWLGVRLGALVSATRRPGIAADLPMMAALIVANLWVVLPTLICTLAVAVLDLIEPAARSTRRPLDPLGQDELTAAVA